VLSNQSSRWRCGLGSQPDEQPEHDIKGGRKIHEQIDEAIHLHDRLLLILSEHSMWSEWVRTEIAKARTREPEEGKRVLFPVRLVDFERLRDWECFDGDTGKDSAREVREYFIPDFSNWTDHDSYQMAFQRLVRDLKAGWPESLNYTERSTPGSVDQLGRLYRSEKAPRVFNFPDEDIGGTSRLTGRKARTRSCVRLCIQVAGHFTAMPVRCQ
jgi:hypothetical protein